MSSQSSLVYAFFLFYLSPFFFSCSDNNPFSLRYAAAVSDISSLPHSDITFWNDDSVPGGLEDGRAAIPIKCTKCFTARLDTGPPTIPPRLWLFFMPLNGVFLISRPVTLNLSPYFPILNLSCQLFLLPHHT